MFFKKQNSLLSADIFDERLFDVQMSLKPQNRNKSATDIGIWDN